MFLWWNQYLISNRSGSCQYGIGFKNEEVMLCAWDRNIESLFIFFRLLCILYFWNTWKSWLFIHFINTLFFFVFWRLVLNYFLNAYWAHEQGFLFSIPFDTLSPHAMNFTRFINHFFLKMFLSVCFIFSNVHSSIFCNNVQNFDVG